MLFSPIHEQDMIDQLAALVGRAAVPATVVNWGGDEAVRMQEWCALMGELIGAEPAYRTSDRAFRGAPVDATMRDGDHRADQGSLARGHDGTGGGLAGAPRLREMAGRSDPDPRYPRPERPAIRVGRRECE